MDLLEYCKREVSNTNQWKVFSQQLFIHIRQHLNAGHVMFFTDLSEQERLHLIMQASEAIKLSNNRAFQEMLAVVSSTMDRSINGYTSLHKGNRSRNEVTMEILAVLSSQLLVKWPNHKHLLLQCFNRTLPAVLRSTVWQVTLHNKQVYQTFVTKATSVASHDPKSSGYHVYQQCQQLIGSKQIFSGLGHSGLSLQVMKDVLTFWRLQCGREDVTQLDILLCVPFVYVRLGELGMLKGRTIEQLSGLVCEQYVSFMTQRPPTMMDQRLSSTQNAMVAMLKRVFQILHGIDETLYQSLRVSLVTALPPHTSEEEAIAVHLVAILHPYVQRLFVGDVPMDVMCFIWDQCFLGLGIGDFQYIPYLIVALLLIMRESLLLCKEVTAISQIINNNLSVVKVQQIQSMIEKHFMRELANQLKAPPLVASHAPYVDPLIEPLPQWTHFPSNQPSVLPNWKELQKQKREVDEAKKRELQDAREAAAEARRQHESQVTELKTEVSRLREELAALKAVPQPAHDIPRDEPRTPSPEATNGEGSDRKLSVGSKADTVSLIHSDPSQHAVSAPPTPKVTKESDDTVTLSNHVISPTHSAITSKSDDSNYVARQQVQETWLTILRNFTKAVDLVCHGLHEEDNKTSR